MNVRPKRDRPPILSEDGTTVVLECEVVSPASAVGRTVYVFFDPATVTDTLLTMRSAAINARRKSEAGTTS